MSEKYVTIEAFEAYKKDLEKKLVVPKKEKKSRPPTEYNLFMKKFRAENPEIPSQSLFEEGAKAWGFHKKEESK